MPLSGESNTYAYAISEKMTNSNKGPIGLPLRRIQSRNALAMSAIEEERASLENSISVAKASSSSSCDTSPTASSSSSDSSPDQSRPVAVRANKSQSARSRSVAKFEEVESASSSPSQAPTRKPRAQSARMSATQSFVSAPMASIKALNSVRSKVLKSCSVQTRSIPCVDEPTTTSSSSTATTKQSQPKKTMKAFSVRFRPVSCFDESLLDETTEQVSKEQKTTKTFMSLRSRPSLCFEDLLASGSTPQKIKEEWKPRAVGTRPASSPTALTSESKTSALSPSSSDEQSTDVERSARQRGLISTPTAGKRKVTRSKSLTNLTCKLAKQNRRFPLKDRGSLTCEDASIDGVQEQKDTTTLSDENLRPRSLSDSASAPSFKRKAKSSLRFRHYEGKFHNRRGQSLLYFSLFPPEKLAMRGIVLHLHGMGDHCRRNRALYKRYCKEGFGVITYDLLNHGASDYDEFNIRANVSNFNHFVDDTNDFITFAKSDIYNVALRYWRKHHHPHHPHGREKKRVTLPELPLIISGASFGSLVGLHTVLTGEHKFHAAVWASPAIGVTWTPVLWAQWKFARPLIAALPTAKVIPAIQHNLRSRDPEFLQKYQDDPLTSSDMITPRSGHQSLNAMMRLQREKRVSNADSRFCGIPMLFLAGSEDRVSDQQATIKFYSRMESLDKEFKLFDGLYHMIYEEPEKEDVLKYLVNWLHKRFPLETRRPNNSHVNVSKKLDPSQQNYNHVKADRTEL